MTRQLQTKEDNSEQKNNYEQFEPRLLITIALLDLETSTSTLTFDCSLDLENTDLEDALRTLLSEATGNKQEKIITNNST